MWTERLHAGTGVVRLRERTFNGRILIYGYGSSTDTGMDVERAYNGYFLYEVPKQLKPSNTRSRKLHSYNNIIATQVNCLYGDIALMALAIYIVSQLLAPGVGDLLAS